MDRASPVLGSAAAPVTFESAAYSIKPAVGEVAITKVSEGNPVICRSPAWISGMKATLSRALGQASRLIVPRENSTKESIRLRQLKAPCHAARSSLWWRLCGDTVEKLRRTKISSETWNIVLSTDHLANLVCKIGPSGEEILEI